MFFDSLHVLPISHTNDDVGCQNIKKDVSLKGDYKYTLGMYSLHELSELGHEVVSLFNSSILDI